MEEDFKVTPMRPLREVLAEFEATIDTEQIAANNGVCAKCNNTNTEVVRNDQGEILGARPSKH